jgi:hypothetical protein
MNYLKKYIFSLSTFYYRPEDANSLLAIGRDRQLGISRFSSSVNQYVLSPFIRNRPQLTRK